MQGESATILRTDPNLGASWEQAGDDQWTVWTDGDRTSTRTITKQGGWFVAWVGFMDRHWCFARALRACADDIRYRREEEAIALAAHEEAIASLMRMTPAQRERLIAKLETERDGLDYAEAHVDVVTRTAMLNRQIERLRGL
jgi:hypothetical protein